MVAALMVLSGNEAKKTAGSMSGFFPSSTAWPATSYFSEVVDIAADGPSTVVITLGSGNADILYILSEYHTGIVFEGATEFPRDAVGTGAFKTGPCCVSS